MFEAAMGRVFHQVDMQDDVLDLAPFLMPRDMPLRSGFQVGTAMAAAMLVALVHPQAARAQAVDACGALDTSGHVTCSGDGNPYDDGITYQAPAAGDAFVDLSVVLQDDVAITTPATLAAPSVNLTAASDAAIGFEAAPGSSITSSTNGQPALRLRSEAGDVQVVAAAVTTYGESARAIDARSSEGGTVIVDAAERIMTYGTYARAITAVSTGGDVGVSAYDVRTYGNNADAIIALGDSVQVDITGGILTEGAGSYGAYVRAHDGTANVRLDGSVYNTGSGSKGIDVRATQGVSVTGEGGVDTFGYIATGVIARTDQGDALVDLAWVTTQGPGADAISAHSSTGNTVVRIGEALSYSDNVSTIDAYGGQSASVEVTGWAAAYGDSATVIDVYSRGRSSVIAAGDVYASGYGGAAIRAEGYDVDLTLAGPVAATGGGEAGVDAAVHVTAGNSFYGPSDATATITNNGSIEAEGDGLGGLRVDSAGSVVISGQGAVTTTGNEAVGIHAKALGDVAISLTEVRTSGADSIAVQAVSAGAMAIDIAAVTVTGDYSDGIVAEAVGSADIRVGNLAALGYNGWGVDLLGEGEGRFSVDVDRIIVAGGLGVLAIAPEGEIDIRVGELIQVGDTFQNAVYATGSVVNVDLGEVRTQGSSLIFEPLAAVLAVATDSVDVRVHALDAGQFGRDGVAAAAVGTASVTVTDGGSINTGGNAIALSAGRSGRVVNGGSISTFGYYARGIVAQSAGSLDIIGGNISTQGHYSHGISALALDSLAITSTVIVTEGVASNAIDAGSGGDIRISVGDLNVSGYGSQAVRAEAGGDIAINIGGVVLGSADQPLYDVVPVGDGGRLSDVSRGTITANAMGTASVTHNGAIITTGIREGGMSVRGEQGVTVSGNGSVSTRGTNATGVYAAANAGLASVEIGDVRTRGRDAFGVLVRSYGTAEATADSVTTRGQGSHGVVVEGAVLASAKAGTVVTRGNNANGVVAHSYGDAYAAAESITVTGEGAIGLDVASYGSGDVEAVVGTVRAHHGRGVGAYARDGSATITAGRVIQSGPTGAEGILALGTTGAAITFGSVSSNGAADNEAGFTAAVAGGSITGDVTIRGDRVSTRGDGRHGVVGRSESGAIVAQVGSVTTIGEASAFHLDTAGDVSLTTQRAISDGAESTLFLRGDDVNVVAGEVHANGAEGAAALRVLASGDADVRVHTVQANGADRTGVLLAADGFAALTVDADGGILAGGDAVVLNADAGSSLRNDGTIMGGNGFALRAYGGAVSVDNRGLIAGALALTDGADLITNTGVLQLTAGTDLGAGNDRIVNNGAVILAGDVDFGAGNDSFVNNGVLVLGSSGMSTFAVAPMARTLIGLESFGNTALIDLRDDIVGDVLTIPGSFAGSGNSTLGLDVAFGQQVAADRLVIGGAATGSTTIALSISGTPQLGLGPVLVQTGAGSSADAFALDPDAAVVGLIEHGLVFDAGNGRFTLATAPSATAYRLLNLTEAAQSLWLTTADTITAQLDSMRQAGSAKLGLWYAMHHSGMRRHEAGSFDAFGFEQQADIGYRQNVTGGQFGFDSGGDGFGFGVTAGYAKSSVNFLAGPERLDIESWNIGAYARYVGDLVFANALVKYDFYDIDANLGTAGKAATDGRGYGAQGEAGLRFVAGGISIEPVIGLSWQHVEADALVLPLRIDFDDREGGRASAGLRLVGTQKLGSDGDTQLRYYLRGDVVQPFAGSGITGFSDASDNVAFLDERIGTHGSARLGLSFTQGALTGFVEGEGRFSSEYRGGGGRVGLRIGF